jgi:hypothetical protein
MACRPHYQYVEFEEASRWLDALIAQRKDLRVIARLPPLHVISTTYRLQLMTATFDLVGKSAFRRINGHLDWDGQRFKHNYARMRAEAAVFREELLRYVMHPSRLKFVDN